MKDSVRKIVESAILIGLAVALDLLFEVIPFFNMPAGGHISLAMLPIVIIGFRNGWVYGIVSGVIYGLLNFFLDGYGLHWGSLFLDYIIAFGVLGLTGFTRKYAKNPVVLLASIFVVCLLRYISTSLSGALFFGEEGASFGASCLYSFITYNLPYLGISTLLVMVCGFLLNIRGLIFYNTDLDPRKTLTKVDLEENDECHCGCCCDSCNTENLKEEKEEENK